jgi:hypothetical protein
MLRAPDYKLIREVAYRCEVPITVALGLAIQWLADELDKHDKEDYPRRFRELQAGFGVD